MTINVKIEDVTEDLCGYRFQPYTGMDKWSVPPHVHDCIMDFNEFEYRVIKVRWWSPHSVTILVQREYGG